MTEIEKAATEMLNCVDDMLINGEWYAAQEKADNLRAILTWGEPVVDRERPIGWLYPEGLEALRAGKPWTIYGTKQDHSNAPVYGAVAQKVEPHESESVEGSIPSLRHQRLEAWKTQQAEPVPVGWLCSPHGSFKRNLLYRAESPPQSIAWQVPVYALTHQQDEPAAVQAEPVVDREAISRALGGDAYWMNPPDGGSVTLFEQVARANKAGREREEYASILARAYDAIEALDGTSLENEKLVDDYRAALAHQQAEPVAEPVAWDSEIVHFAKTALHEMPRPATDWHHCAKRVCEAVVASRQQAEPVAEVAARSASMWERAEAMRRSFDQQQAEPVVALAHIASLSHEGGLIGLSQWECLVEIRRLSLPYASLTGGPRDVKARLDAALIAASR